MTNTINVESGTVQNFASFDERVSASLPSMSPAEQRVSRYFQDHREKVLMASATALAKQAGASDATVIRTAKALGFSGMADLRRTLAAELRESLLPANRLASTLDEVGDDLQAAFNFTLNIHQQAVADLRRDITPEKFRTAIRFIDEAQRLLIFGIGPSSAMAGYFEIQLGRFGIEARCLTQTGLLLADGLQKMRKGDLLLMFAYGRVYRELAALLAHADRHDVPKILITDTLGGALGQRVDLVLTVARGKADMLSMHTATLSLIETLLVGLATTRPDRSMASLKSLNGLRNDLVGKSMDL